MSKYSTNLGLPEAPLTDNSELFGELSRLYNAARALAYNLDALTGALRQDSELWSQLTPLSTILSQNTHRLYVEYSETVLVGQIVTLWNDAGKLKAKKAGGNPWAGDARGYCSIPAGVVAGNFGEVILLGLHPYASGMTPGSTYYLSDTVAGTITPTVPATRVQPLGYALSDTILFFNPVILA